MISIRHSLDELDHLDEHQRLVREQAAAEHEQQLRERQETILKCYGYAIRSAREYAVEFEPELAAGFRKRLKRLETDLSAAAEARDYEALQSAFRGELRRYRDRGQAILNRLRSEVEESAAAMQTLTNAVTVNGADYETDLHQELGKLGAAAGCDDLPVVKATIVEASAAIQQSFERMQAGNQVVIAQLQDEIRGLHQAMENERRALNTDSATGAWNQRKLAERLDQLLKLDESFGVLMICVTNWKSLCKQYSAHAAEPFLKSLVARLQHRFNAEGNVGRWSENVFAVIVETDPAAAAELVAGADQKFSGLYAPESPIESGMPNLSLQLKSAFIGRKRGTDAADLYPQIGQQVSSLTE